jgi:glycosyltransferase involved in cell wall biosynthesis
VRTRIERSAPALRRHLGAVGPHVASGHPRPGGEGTRTVDVSVVVPTRGRPRLLARCLDALDRQTLPRDRYEVVVVDDGPDEATRRVAAEHGAAYVAAGPHRGPAAARNVGWQLARAEVVAFTDDDTLPDPDWLAAGLRAIEAGADGVAGRIQVPIPERPTDYERDAAGLETAEFATANCFYRRAALAAVGGFDERFPIAWREDADLFFTMVERGYRLERATDALVVHPLRPAGWGVSISQQRKAGLNALLYKKHPALYRQRIQPGPPWRYYATLGWLALGVLGLAKGWRRLARLGLGAWAGMTLQFAAHRLRGASHHPAHVAEMVVTSAIVPLLSVFWRLRGAVRYRVLFL